MPTKVRVGGSSAKRVIKCPRSLALCSLMPEPPTSKDAEEGTAAHEVCELALLNGEPTSELIDAEINGVLVTEEMANACAIFVEHVRKHFTAPDGQIDLVVRSTLHVEQEVALTGFVGWLEGKCDCFLYDPDSRTLYVFDLKYGEGVTVEAVESEQLLFYALGASIKLGEPIKKVVATIIQPRVDHPDGPIRSWRFEPIRLIEFGFDLEEAIQKADDPATPLNPGDWCQFCDAAPKCPALLALAEKAKAFEAEDALLATFGETLEPEEIGRRLALIEPVRHWLASFKRFAWHEAMRGRVAEGFKLVETKGKRRFAEGEKAMAEAAELFGVEPDKLFKKKPITPRQLEKLVGIKPAKDFLVEPRVVKSRGLALVPLSDKRDPVPTGALSEFEDILLEGEENGEE